MKKHKGRTRMLASAGIAVALILGVTAVTDAKPKGKKDLDRKARPGWRAEKWGEKPPCMTRGTCPLGRYGRRPARSNGRGYGPGRGMRNGRGRSAGRGMRGGRGRGMGRGPGRGMRGGRGRGMGRGPGRGPGRMTPCPLGGPGLGMGRGLGPGACLGRLGMAPDVDVDVKGIDDGARLVITSEDEEVAEMIRERLHRMVEMREDGWRPLAARRRAFRKMREKRQEALEERREARKERDKDEWKKEKPERRKHAREKREKKEKYDRAEKREHVRRMIRQEVHRALKKMKEHHEEKEEH